MGQKISIIIVNLNEPHLTLGCVDSIVEHTQGVEYEIVVVDNGSGAGAFGILQRGAARIKLIGLDRNMFFGEASNIGVEHATGNLVLFLNNDIKVTAGWIEPLIAVLETEYCAGAVGAKILEPNGELLEAGGVIRPDGWGIQIGKGGMELPRDFIDGTRIADYCSGACLLMRRNVFLDLAGFDPIFDPAYFEDVDLAIRLRSIGLFSYYCGASVVYHEESTTSNRIWSAEERRGYIAANHARLMRRWGLYLKLRIEQDPDPQPRPAIRWEPENVAARPSHTVVLYSSSPLRADTCQLLLPVAAALQDYCTVLIATNETYSRCRLYSLAREFGVELRSFGMRRIADIEPGSCQLIVAFGEEGVQPNSGPLLVFEKDGAQLLPLLDHLMTSG